MECDGQRIVCLCCEKYSQTFSLRPYAVESALEELLEELQADVRQHLAREIPMLILTNAGKTYGACCILYPKVLEQLAKRVDGVYYLIPSSVHEFILLPVDQGRSAEELKEMIVEVNSTELTRKRFLSDQLYLYSSQERCDKNTLILTGHM